MIEMCWDVLSKKIPLNSPQQTLSYQLKGFWQKVQLQSNSYTKSKALKLIAKEYLLGLEIIFVKKSNGFYSFDDAVHTFLTNLSTELNFSITGYFRACSCYHDKVKTFVNLNFLFEDTHPLAIATGDKFLKEINCTYLPFKWNDGALQLEWEKHEKDSLPLKRTSKRKIL